MILYISPKYGCRPDTVRLIEAARKRNIHTETLLNRWNGQAPKGEPLAFYGEHAFCEFMAQELRYNLHQNSLDWVAQLPHAFVKRSVKCISLKEVIELENTTQQILGKRILEPADDPCFLGGIHEDRFPRVPDKTPILVSTDHEWVAKYRMIIINGRIATRCCYRVDNIFNTPTIWGMEYEERGINSIAFTRALLSHTNTAPACVIDVGMMKGLARNEGWAVCGTYPIWSSPVFGCDPSQFLDGLFEACQPVKRK